MHSFENPRRHSSLDLRPYSTRVAFPLCPHFFALWSTLACMTDIQCVCVCVCLHLFLVLMGVSHWHPPLPTMKTQYLFPLRPLHPHLRRPTRHQNLILGVSPSGAVEKTIQ